MAKENGEQMTIDMNYTDHNTHMRSFMVKQVEQNAIMTTSNKLPDDDFKIQGISSKLIAPPFDPISLSTMAENSTILNQCIDVMEVNIESFGVDFVPAMDDETFEELKKEQEEAQEKQPDKTPVGAKDETGKKKEVKKLIEIDQEFQDLSNFFKYVSRTMSYVQMRRRTRRDYELTGNGYWEILRNHLTQKITGAEWVPSGQSRIGRIDRFFTDYKAKHKVSDTVIESVPDKKKFRRYAQVKESGAKPMWFKEFGDPRIMDAETGAMAIVERNDKGQVTTIKNVKQKNFDDFDIDKFKKGDMKIATEILHFLNYNSARALPYGSPRWMGTLISIIGSRASEEVNVLYFDNKCVPPGMLLVSGGRLGKDTAGRITTHIKDHVKGTKNYHSILVVEAENQPHPNLPAPQVPKIQWVSMVAAQTKDALFQNYDQSNTDKVISTFRFWPGYVGRVKDVNRATADTAKELSEEQVFGPERMEFDSIINRTLLVEMGINYWEHKSKGPQLTTPDEMASLLVKTEKFLTRKEGREIVSKIFNVDLKELDAVWTNLPADVLQSIASSITSVLELLDGDSINRINEDRKEAKIDDSTELLGAGITEPDPADGAGGPKAPPFGAPKKPDEGTPPKPGSKDGNGEPPAGGKKKPAELPKDVKKFVEKLHAVKEALTSVEDTDSFVGR